MKWNASFALSTSELLTGSVSIRHSALPSAETELLLICDIRDMNESARSAVGIRIDSAPSPSHESMRARPSTASTARPTAAMAGGTTVFITYMCDEKKRFASRRMRARRGGETFIASALYLPRAKWTDDSSLSALYACAVMSQSMPAAARLDMIKRITCGALPPMPSANHDAGAYMLSTTAAEAVNE